MKKNVPELCTERLILREINESDGEEIVKWRSDPMVYKKFKSPHRITMEEHLNWYNKIYLPDCNLLSWMGSLIQDNRKIGIFGLALQGEIAEVSYLLAFEAQHKGYSTEAVKEIIKYAFSSGIKQVIAEIHKENRASINLVERIGFQYICREGIFLRYGIEERMA